MAERYDEQLLLGYLEGDLDAAQQARVEQQIAGDARLRSLLTELRHDRALLRGIEAEPAPPHLMEQVRQRLERQMLLGPPAADAGRGDALRRDRFRRALRVLGAAAVVVVGLSLVLSMLVDLQVFWPRADDTRRQAAKRSEPAGSTPAPTDDALAMARPVREETPAGRAADRVAARPEPAGPIASLDGGERSEVGAARRITEAPAAPAPPAAPGLPALELRMAVGGSGTGADADRDAANGRPPAPAVPARPGAPRSDSRAWAPAQGDLPVAEAAGGAGVATTAARKGEPSARPVPAEETTAVGGAAGASPPRPVEISLRITTPNAAAIWARLWVYARMRGFGPELQTLPGSTRALVSVAKSAVAEERAPLTSRATDPLGGAAERRRGPVERAVASKRFAGDADLPALRLTLPAEHLAAVLAQVGSAPDQVARLESPAMPAAALVGQWVASVAGRADRLGDRRGTALGPVALAPGTPLNLLVMLSEHAGATPSEARAAVAAQPVAAPPAAATPSATTPDRPAPP